MIWGTHTGNSGNVTQVQKKWNSEPNISPRVGGSMGPNKFNLVSKEAKRTPFVHIFFLESTPMHHQEEVMDYLK